MRRRLQELFFRGDRRVNATVVYVDRESERAKLQRSGHVKLELRDAAGSTVVITADPSNLRAA